MYKLGWFIRLENNSDISLKADATFSWHIQVDMIWSYVTFPCQGKLQRLKYERYKHIFFKIYLCANIISIFWVPDNRAVLFNYYSSYSLFFRLFFRLRTSTSFSQPIISLFGRSDEIHPWRIPSQLLSVNHFNNYYPRWFYFEYYICFVQICSHEYDSIIIIIFTNSLQSICIDLF